MSVLIVVLADGLLTHFFPCCAFAVRSFPKVSATPGGNKQINKNIDRLLLETCTLKANMSTSVTFRWCYCKSTGSSLSTGSIFDLQYCEYMTFFWSSFRVIVRVFMGHSIHLSSFKVAELSHCNLYDMAQLI